jgi:N6-L-threonylcarbamoyladenine synthase
MLCLGIETSCDETAVALVRDGSLVGEKISSQVDMHSVFGGVVPELASREHLRILCPLVDSLLEEHGFRPEHLEGVAVARGPGLLGSLLVGLGMAKGLALSTGAKLIGVDHCKAHLLATGLEKLPEFPALGLLVSGGHTQIYRMQSALDFILLGKTLDDAAGEAFDKVAKLLNLPYPGGAIIDRLARMGTPDQELFPRPYLDNQNVDFSFSGLKTAVAKYIHNHPSLRVPYVEGQSDIAHIAGDRPELIRVCASFNFSVAETLRIKLERAAEAQKSTKSLVIAGGVAANSMVREAMHGLATKLGIKLFLPSPSLCTDNGAMIAYTGELLLGQGYRHDLHLDAIPRGRTVPEDALYDPPLTTGPGK